MRTPPLPAELEANTSPIVDHASTAPERHTIPPEVFQDARLEKIPTARLSWDLKEVTITSASLSTTSSTEAITSASASSSETRPPRRTLGLRRSNFLLALALVIMASAAVAIGLGIGIASRHTVRPSSSSSSSSSSPSTSPTTTPSSNYSTTTTNASDCTPHSNFQSPRTCNVYTKSCSMSWSTLFWGSPLLNFPAADFDTCILACDSFNYWLRGRVDDDTGVGGGGGGGGAGGRGAGGGEVNVTGVVYGTNNSLDPGYVPGMCFCASLNFGPGGNLSMMDNPGVNVAVRDVGWMQTACVT